MSIKRIVGLFKERMRGQLYVPTVSTISLVAVLIGVSVALYNGQSQRQRWEKEDHRQDPRPQVGWSNELIRGKYRTLNLATQNALSNPIRLISIDVASPDGATVVPYSDYATRKFETPSKISPVNRRILANTFDSVFYIAFSMPNAPNDQGTFVEFQVNYEEIASPLRPFSQIVRTYIPMEADKQSMPH